MLRGTTSCASQGAASPPQTLGEGHPWGAASLQTTADMHQLSSPLWVSSPLATPAGLCDFPVLGPDSHAQGAESLVTMLVVGVIVVLVHLLSQLGQGMSRGT